MSKLLKCPLSNSQCWPIVPNIHQPSGRTRPSDKGVGRSSRPWDKGGTSPKKFSQPFGPQFGLKIGEGSPGSATASGNRYLATKLHRPACQLLVCTWRHGGHVGGQEQKHFSPLGTKLYFHVHSLRNILLFWPPTWPPCHVVANQELSINTPPPILYCYLTDDSVI